MLKILLTLNDCDVYHDEVRTSLPETSSTFAATWDTWGKTQPPFEFPSDFDELLFHAPPLTALVFVDG